MPATHTYYFSICLCFRGMFAEFMTILLLCVFVCVAAAGLGGRTGGLRDPLILHGAGGHGGGAGGNGLPRPKGNL